MWYAKPLLCTLYKTHWPLYRPATTTRPFGLNAAAVTMTGVGCHMICTAAAKQGVESTLHGFTHRLTRTTRPDCRFHTRSFLSKQPVKK